MIGRPQPSRLPARCALHPRAQPIQAHDLPRHAHELGTGLDTWDASELIELARANVRAGDPAAARALLNREIAESVGQMLGDSILADVSLLDGDWSG